MSKRHKLSKTDRKNWVVNMKRFIAPVIILYLMQVISTIGLDGHVVTTGDFLPNQYTQGGILLYVMNSTLDVVTKWKNVT